MNHTCTARLVTRGFSMVQLMVTLTIIAILTGLAVPGYRYVTTSTRISGEVNNLLGDLQFARYQAIKQGQPVTVCPAATPYTGCLSASTTNWTSGWIVFNDVNGNGTVDTGEAVIRIQQALSGTDTLTLLTGGTGRVTFNREGYPVALTSIVTLGLHSTPVGNQWTRCVQVGINGQVLTELYGAGSCT